jgi:PIN domain nuclease of toxin-antitoxin system
VKILLDTCTFLWIAFDSPRLGKNASEIFLDENNERYLSAASAWEISLKYASGKLPLFQRPEVFIPKIRESSDIATLDIDEESALHAGRLPPLHADPFDRMLIAQAIIHGMVILTPDPLIERYAVRVLW